MVLSTEMVPETASGSTWPPPPPCCVWLGASYMRNCTRLYSLDGSSPVRSWMLRCVRGPHAGHSGVKNHVNNPSH